MNATSPVSPARSRRTLLMIFGLSLIPVVAATLYYYIGPSRPPQTYGQLLMPIEPAADRGLQDGRGQPASLAALSGKWLLVTVADGACDATCRRQLHAARQIRLSQGKDLDRLRRVWLVSDATAPAALAAEDGEELTVLQAGGSPLLAQLAKRGEPRGALFVIDPHGNLVFRYGPEADPNRILREVGKLLKNNSGIG